MAEITNRHRKLYEFLCASGDNWMPQYKVARELYAEFGNDECCLAPETYHETLERKVLSNAIADINGSTEFEKIIISSSKGIKIASENDFAAHIRRQYSAIFRKLRRIRAMEKKARLHNQIGIDGESVDAFLEKIPETT